jgi:hypothetical protein
MRSVVFLSLLTLISLIWYIGASRRAFELQVLLIEANCEKKVAIETHINIWPTGKVCEVETFDIVTGVVVRAGQHKWMECDEIVAPLFFDMIDSCEFSP